MTLGSPAEGVNGLWAPPVDNAVDTVGGTSVLAVESLLTRVWTNWLSDPVTRARSCGQKNMTRNAW